MSKYNSAKAYLSQIRILDLKIDAQLEEVARLRATLTKTTTTLRESGGSGGGEQDKLGTAIAKIVDYEAQINTWVDEYVEKKTEIIRKLNKIQNAEYFEILTRRFIRYQTLEQIALEMHMTYRNICYKLNGALGAMEKILKEDD